MTTEAVSWDVDGRTASISRCRSSCRYTLSCASPLIVVGLIVALETVPILQKLVAEGKLCRPSRTTRTTSPGTRHSSERRAFASTMTTS